MISTDKPHIVFMGTSEFAVPVLRALYQNKYDIRLVISQPDRPRGRNRKMVPTPVKTIAEQLGLPVYQPEKLKKTDCIKVLTDIKPNLIITASYGQILKKQHLQIPRKGILNVHASLLPDLRGPAPVQTALILGKSKTGVSIMLTDIGIDSGPIVTQKSLNILDTDTAGTLEKKLSWLGAELLIDTIPQYLSGTIRPVAQDHSKASYTRMLKKNDGWIDWNRSARDLAFQIRGMNPCPGAYTSCGDKRLKIHFARPYNLTIERELPGTVLNTVKGKGVLIQTGDGVLLCEEIQPACRKKMPGETLIHGRYSFTGDVLGKLPSIGDTECQQ
jgi:methionyl-tRNA formyltransferase